MRQSPTTSHLRGCLVGATVGALATAAHGVAGGGLPDSRTATLVLLVAIVAGYAATMLCSPVGNSSAGHPRRSASAKTADSSPTRGGLSRGGLSHGGPSALIGILAAGQFAGHGVLSSMPGHAHGTSTAGLAQLPTGWMLIAHAVATGICAALILIAERLYAVASSTIRAVLTKPVPPPTARRAPRYSHPGIPQYRVPRNGAVGPRAPPVLV